MLPMPPTRSKLIAVSSQALKQVWDNNIPGPSEERQSVHIETVSNILQTNLSNGRAQYALGNDATEITDICLQQYGLRVATHYWMEHKRMTALIAGDKKLWEELRRRFMHRAYHVLCAYAGLSPAAAYGQAPDHAQEACQRILRGRYPYDVPFYAWATRILINCVLERLNRSGDLLDRGSFVEFDAEHPLTVNSSSRGYGESWQALNSRGNFPEDIEKRHLILDAIAQLSSEAQRQVILLDFFYEWEDTKIAEALDKTCQAVYNLRHRALRGLKEVLEQQEGLGQSG